MKRWGAATPKITAHFTITGKQNLYNGIINIMAQHHRSAHARHLADKVVPVKETLVNREDTSTPNPKNADQQWRQASTSGITEMAEPSASTTPTVQVVRGDGKRASTYYYGDKQILLKNKVSSAAKGTYAVSIGVNAVLYGSAAATAAIGLIPVSAGILAVSANDLPNNIKNTKDFLKGYKSEAVSPEGVETLATMDSFDLTHHNGFTPTQDIESVRVYLTKDKIASERHFGVEIIKTDGTPISLSMSRQPTNQQHLVEELAERIGQTLGKPVDTELKIYTQKEIEEHSKTIKAPTLLRRITKSLGLSRNTKQANPS